MNLKGVLKPEELAERFGLTEETVLGWRELGMPWIKVGKMIFILEASFLRWMKGREIQRNAQDASEQDFFGRPMSEARPQKN